MSKFDEMKAIRDELLTRSDLPLYEYRISNKYFPVVGEGSHDARVLFIGEAPGENEAKTGKPFCGRAGRILDALLESISVPRESVYITNIVKDRPPANRDPEPSEIEIYAPYLDRQIEIIKPKAISTLGRFSMKYIMEKFGLGEALQPISKIHGNVFIAKTNWGEFRIIPLFHPAVAVYNASSLDALKEDFKLLKEYM